MITSNGNKSFESDNNLLSGDLWWRILEVHTQTHENLMGWMEEFSCSKEGENLNKFEVESEEW